MNDEKLPIAEIFHSLQGEGQWTGTPMLFVRLAGCTVGQHQSQEAVQYEMPGELPILKSGKPAWLCHTYDGRPFWCDTDFNKYDEKTVTDILAEAREYHICLTGGEPLMHVDKWVFLFDDSINRQIHIETSGTIPFDVLRQIEERKIWISVSPKQNVLPEMLQRADEIKLLVDADFDPEKVHLLIHSHPNVYLQPINLEDRINPMNVNLIFECLKRYPYWKLSVQLHKVFGWR